MLLFLVSQASLTGKSCQFWLPLLPRTFDLNIFSLDPSLLLWSTWLLQRAYSSPGFHQSCWDLRLLFSIRMLESTPVKELTSLSHFCAAEFISLMIWPLFAFISAFANWTGASLLAVWREKDGPATSQWNWVRMATLLGKQVSLPEKLFFSPHFYPERIYPSFPALQRYAFHGNGCKRMMKHCSFS